MTKTKKVQVSFTPDQWRLIASLKGALGKDDAEVVRNIVLNWLSEKSIVSEWTKQKLRGSSSERREHD